MGHFQISLFRLPVIVLEMSKMLHFFNDLYERQQQSLSFGAT